jgi:hypothetical protein
VDSILTANADFAGYSRACEEILGRFHLAWLSSFGLWLGFYHLIQPVFAGQSQILGTASGWHKPLRRTIGFLAEWHIPSGDLGRVYETSGELS